MDERVRRVMKEVVRGVEGDWDGPERDPARIDAILSKLLEIWMLDPDMRFGQLVYNLYWQMPETRKMGMTGIDMFHVEDDAFDLRLDEVIHEGWR
ncbi:hypothetical protein DIC75_09215 [Methanoculleus sp. CWC-02]|uniref:Uncharacterized protein n=2 Tax=Methanoculleus oceani TaxID=2184756 RepID=A0ABD4TEC4_9EURY|nr:hypothetical protein [Methanoculleus sp. CWC-02]